MTASTTPVARPFSTGRVGAGTDAAATALVPTVAACTDPGEAGPRPAASPACLICGAPAVPGDDLALCQADGGLGPGWAGFEAAWLAGREAC